MNLLLACRRE